MPLTGRTGVGWESYPREAVEPAVGYCEEGRLPSRGRLKFRLVVWFSFLLFSFLFFFILLEVDWILSMIRSRYLWLKDFDKGIS